MKRNWQGSEREKHSLDLYIKLKRTEISVERRIADKKPLPGRLTTSQFAVLEALHFHGSLQQSSIASKVLTSTGNLTFVIDNLVKAGLVERRAHKHDRRIKTVELTEKGSDLIAEVFPNMANAITESLSVLTDLEIMEISRLLKILGTGMRDS